MYDSLSQVFGPTVALGKAGLAGITGAATTHNVGTAFNYAINGKAYNKATVTGGATPTADAVTGAAFAAISANQGSVFVFGVDSAGTVKAAQGGIEAMDKAGTFLAAPQFPTLPDTICPFGYVVVKGGATVAAPWTFGTSNWNATGITVAVQDVIGIPGRPQVS